MDGRAAQPETGANAPARTSASQIRRGTQRHARSSLRLSTRLGKNAIAGAAAGVAEQLEAYASLRPQLLTDVNKLAGARILPGNFMTVQQAIGTEKKNAAGAAFLRDFIAEAKSSGLVARLIEKHRVVGLSVAP